MNELMDYIELAYEFTEKMIAVIGRSDVGNGVIGSYLAQYNELFTNLKRVSPYKIYSIYEEFFASFGEFCMRCSDEKFLVENRDDVMSSLELVCECLEDMKLNCFNEMAVCPCCGSKVFYMPIAPYYELMSKKYGAKNTIDETLNPEKYMCPKCGCVDRDRLIVSFLKLIGLENASSETKVLQIAPSPSIHNWIKLNCPQIEYETSDLYMDGVDYKSDIQDMKEISDKTYDLIICSHVLEHVQDDNLALESMKRILKDDGRVIFLVPVDLGIEEIDEQWGCPEEENWKRFGQGDHCRRYSHNGLVKRLERHFFTHLLGKQFFGQDIFDTCGMTDTSILYVLTKNENVHLKIVNNEHLVDYDLCDNGPLVSVVLPCYNHAPFVAEAIESVINQSYKNIEFIIGDDASSDETPKIIKKYSKYYAKAVFYTENAGGCDQELSQFATGKYLALMHSDDIWDPDKIAIQVKYMEEHPECGACFTWCEYTDEEKNILNDRVFIQPNRSRADWIYFFWKKGNALCNPSSLIRRNMEFKTKRYGSENRQLPDLFKWVDFVQNVDIHIITKRMTYMRRYNNKVRQNSSAISSDSLKRNTIEFGLSWLPIIRDMDSEMFKESFKSCLIDKQANDDKAIKCEKLFVLLNSPNIFVQHSGLCYYNEILPEVKEVLEKKYGYTGKKYRADELNKGIGTILGDWSIE